MPCQITPWNVRIFSHWQTGDICHQGAWLDKQATMWTLWETFLTPELTRLSHKRLSHKALSTCLKDMPGILWYFVLLSNPMLRKFEFCPPRHGGGGLYLKYKYWYQFQYKVEVHYQYQYWEMVFTDINTLNTYCIQYWYLDAGSNQYLYIDSYQYLNWFWYPFFSQSVSLTQYVVLPSACSS